MPPKRKALSSTSGNATVDTNNAKAAKTSLKQTASKASAEKKAKKQFKYSDPKTLEDKPTFINLQWPNIADFIDDPDCQDMPKNGELIDEYCFRVSDLGIPVSKDGMEVLEKFSRECEKRDQDIEGVYIYNDWNGWGIQEAMDNLLKDFDKVVKKKSVSPFKKWAFAEAIACWSMGDLMDFISNEDGEGVEEHAEMLGLMVLTCIDALKEHDLFTPNSEVKNIPIICLIALEFAVQSCQDLEITWACEVVRLCDDAGIKLDDHVRKQVNISKKDLKKLRGEYKSNPEGTDKDWKSEFKEYRREHPGGVHYDLTKMSKAKKKTHSLGAF